MCELRQYQLGRIHGLARSPYSREGELDFRYITTASKRNITSAALQLFDQISPQKLSKLPIL